jgi:long-chain acyl-CoA synthetase
LVAEFGIWKIGAVVVGVNPTYSERELEQILDTTRAETVFTLTPFYNRLKSVQGRTSVKRIIATSIKEYLPATLRLLFTLFKEAKEGHRITLANDDLWLQHLLTRHRDAPRPAVTVNGGSRCDSVDDGTTGTPKVVGLHRHYVTAGCSSTSEVSQAAMVRRHHAAAAAVSRLRQRRRPAARIRRTQSAR